MANKSAAFLINSKCREEGGRFKFTCYSERAKEELREFGDVEIIPVPKFYSSKKELLDDMKAENSVLQKMIDLFDLSL